MSVEFSSQPLAQEAQLFPNPNRGELLTFDTTGLSDNLTLYNPSIPFVDQGREVIMARTESLDREDDSEIVVFDMATRQVVTGAPRFKQAQDPYYLGRFKDENNALWHVLGMVKITVDPVGVITSWRDEFFKYGESITELSLPGSEPQPFAAGVSKWKDTRFVQLTDTIAVFPRPQGDFGDKGTIGYFETANLQSLEADLQAYADTADDTTLLDGVFPEGAWGGANQLLPDEDSRYINVLGHMAMWNAGKRDYASTYFNFDRATRQAGPVATIARATDFEYVQPKLDSLGDVVFTAGMVPSETTGKHWLYVGVADCQIGRILIGDPRSGDAPVDGGNALQIVAA